MQRPNSLPTEQMLSMLQKNSKKMLVGVAILMTGVFAIQMHDYVLHANATVKNVNIQNIESWKDLLYMAGEKNLSSMEIMETVTAFQTKNLKDPLIAERVQKIDKLMPPLGLMPNDALYKDITFTHEGHNITITQEDVLNAQKSIAIFNQSASAYEAPSLLSASMIIATYRATHNINTALKVSDWKYAPMVNNEVLVNNNLISEPSKAFLKIIYNQNIQEKSLGL